MAALHDFQFSTIQKYATFLFFNRFRSGFRQIDKGMLVFNVAALLKLYFYSFFIIMKVIFKCVWTDR